MPLPKGPFKVMGKGCALEFKNPFFGQREFSLIVENTSFTCSQKSPLKIDGKKTV